MQGVLLIGTRANARQCAPTSKRQPESGRCAAQLIREMVLNPQSRPRLSVGVSLRWKVEIFTYSALLRPCLLKTTSDVIASHPRRHGKAVLAVEMHRDAPHGEYQMRQLIILLTVLCGAVIPAVAQVSIGIGIGVPNMNIGINFPVYPQFQQVPGYPVYYAPQVDSNYFFYDGMYWVYANDSWYASSWYNGPWALVSPMVVPVYILRVPVRYYREPPVYFRGWRQDAPPRWDDHWGDDWRRQRSGWDHWNHNAVPPTCATADVSARVFGSSVPFLRSAAHDYYPELPLPTA